MLTRGSGVFYLLVSLGVFFISSCRSNSSYPSINNGILTSGYPSVVQLFFETGVHTHICTGTVLSSNTVLTAAHCIGGGKKEGKVKVVFDNGLEVETSTIMTSSLYESEKVRNESIMESSIYDIGVVVFDDGTFKESSSIKMIDHNIKTGDQVLMVGYGCVTTSTVSEETGKKIVVCSKPTYRVKRYGTNYIHDTTRCVDGMIQVNQRKASVDSEYSEPTGIDTLVWGGDSGGPLFLGADYDRSAVERLIGISSYASENYTNGRFSCYTNPMLSANVEFLKQAVKKIGARIDFE